MKKEKSIKIIGVILLCSLSLYGCQGQVKKSSNEIEKQKLAQNQVITIGQISAIKGNEMTISVATEGAIEERGSGKGSNRMPQQKSATESNGAASSQENAMPQGEAPPDMQAGGNPDRQMPMEQQESENTKKRMAEEQQDSQVVYSLTGEEKTMCIPVGTKVTTQLGTITTFSRLAVEDMIKMIVETDENGKEIIVAIWIVG